MAYTRQSRTDPSGGQTGSAFATSALANDKAIQDQVLAGLGDGWEYSQSGGTAEEPTTVLLTYKPNTQIVFKATLTWTSGNITGATFALSTTGSGGTFDTIGSAAVFTYDGSGNLTASTNFGGLLLKLFELRGKQKTLKSAHDTHVATTSNVHGIPATSPIAAQQYTAVNIDGGSIDGTTIGGATPAAGSFTRATEQFASYAPGSGGGVTLDWSYGGSSLTNNGTNALTFSNVPTSRIATHALYCTNFNNTTFPAAVTWGVGGKPSIAGAALVQLATFDGATTTVFGIVAWKAV